MVRGLDVTVVAVVILVAVAVAIEVVVVCAIVAGVVMELIVNVAFAKDLDWGLHHEISPSTCYCFLKEYPTN